MVPTMRNHFWAHLRSSYAQKWFHSRDHYLWLTLIIGEIKYFTLSLTSYFVALFLSHIKDPTLNFSSRLTTSVCACVLSGLWPLGWHFVFRVRSWVQNHGLVPLICRACLGRPHTMQWSKPTNWWVQWC